MIAIPNRAPIAYVDLRRPYNLVRAAGAIAFIIGIIVWSAVNGSPTAWLLGIPAIVVAIEHLARVIDERGIWP